MISLPLAKDWVIIVPILIIVYVIKYYHSYYTRQSPLPGPFPLPFIGNLHQIGLSPAQYAMKNHHKFGDMFEIWAGSKRFIFLSHARLIDQIFSSSTKNIFFSRLAIPHFQKNDMHHGLIFNDNYQSWKRNRRFVAQSLMSAKFLKQFTHLTQSLFNENEAFWDKDEYHLDFAKWIKCFTTDITLHTVTRKPSYCLTTYLFGEDHGDPSKSEEIKESVNFTSSIQTFVNSVLFQALVPELLKNYFPGFYNLNKKYQDNNVGLNKTILDIIKRRRKEISNGDKVDSNLIDILLTLNTPHDHEGGCADEEDPMTDHEIRATILDVCSAGIDTTGNTFCYIVWQLAHNPKVLARFQDEIREHVGDDITRPLVYEDLEKFTYLDAIIKETIRIIPLIPLLTRTSSQECVIGGKHWDADTTFITNVERVQKSPDIWEDAEQFIPERFLKETYNETVKYSFLPFAAGLRVCPGKLMALVELKTLLVLLYRKYDVELVDKKATKPSILHTIINVCTDLKVVVRPRKRF